MRRVSTGCGIEFDFLERRNDEVLDNMPYEISKYFFHIESQFPSYLETSVDEIRNARSRLNCSYHGLTIDLAFISKANFYSHMKDH